MAECKRKRNEVEKLWHLKWPEDKSNVSTKGGSRQQWVFRARCAQVSVSPITHTDYKIPWPGISSTPTVSITIHNLTVSKPTYPATALLCKASNHTYPNARLTSVQGPEGPSLLHFRCLSNPSNSTLPKLSASSSSLKQPSAPPVFSLSLKHTVNCPILSHWNSQSHPWHRCLNWYITSIT